MGFNTYFICFVCGILGIALHLFAVKIPSIKTGTSVANMKFSYGAFFQDELAAILASVLTVIIALVLLDEWIAVQPSVVPYLKAAFVFVGFTGSSILVSLIGKAQGKIDTIVNIKTDISDGKLPVDTPLPKPESI